MKILIAEDDLTSRNMLQAILGKWGYEVIVTCDGAEAYAALQQEDTPQLALLDWEMPVLDGAAVCRKLRTQKSYDPLYLILLTSRGNREDIVLGLEAGADDYITKPYDNHELRARISVGSRMIRLRNELRERDKLQGMLEMAGAVCHELNQPLQSVSAFSELLLMNLGDNDPNLEMLKNIRGGIERLGKLTRKIMNITRYQSKPYLGKSKIIDIEAASRPEER